MSDVAYDRMGDEEYTDSSLHALRPVPRISIQAFCETEGVAKPIERAGEDRRLPPAAVGRP